MFTNNDDTLNAGTQNATQNNNPSEKEELKSKKWNLKDAATFVAGGLAGGAASMAANAFADTLNSTEEPQEPEMEDVQEEPVVEEPVPTPQPAPQPKSEPEPEPKPEPKHEPTHQPKPEEEPAFYRENKVEVESIETSRTDDDEVRHVAHGTVNGHEAHFVDDGHGNVVGYGIDENDNHEIEESEVVHAEGQGVTMGNLAEHMVEVEPTPAPTPTGNIQVLAVANDVEMGEHTVNVAVIAHGETTGLMIDANQNGEVDVIAVDANHDDHYSEDETEVVTDAHMPMPTQDDVSPDMASNGVADGGDLPDYSNDSDITMYDV